MNSEIDYTNHVRLYKTETKFWQIVINPADTLQADVRSGKLDEKGEEDLGSDISLKKNNRSLSEADYASKHIMSKLKEGYLPAENTQPLDDIISHISLSRDKEDNQKKRHSENPLTNEEAKRVKKNVESQIEKEAEGSEEQSEGKRPTGQSFLDYLRSINDDDPPSEVPIELIEHRKIIWNPDKKKIRTNRRIVPLPTPEEMREVGKAYEE